MAYGLVVGKSPKVNDEPVIVGQIEFEELRCISALLKKMPCGFLEDIQNIFNDSVFTLHAIELARQSLHDLLPMELSMEERAMLHKLLAVLSFASARQQSLYGVAD